MKKLIEKLEKATSPDGGLDVMIAEAIGLNTWHGTTGGHASALPYTSSLDAAMTLVPDDDHHWKCGYSRYVRHNAEVADLMHPDKGIFVGECDSSRAIALCIAALKARAAHD